MEEQLAISTHFFNVMAPDFQNHLDLPSSFCKKLKEEQPKRAILISRIGKWKTDVCRNSEGLICFQNGWPQFVDHHRLSIGDFLVFEHIGDFHFNVSIFHHTACEKEFPLEPNNKRESDDAAFTSHHNSQNPHFVLTMKPSFAKEKPKVNIPAEFVRSNNIIRRYSCITMRDPDGRAWPVNLMHERTGQLRVFMCKGWYEFYVSNDLKFGDVCVFELNRCSLQPTTTVMDVQILRAPVV